MAARQRTASHVQQLISHNEFLKIPAAVECVTTNFFQVFRQPDLFHFQIPGKCIIIQCSHIFSFYLIRQDHTTVCSIIFGDHHTLRCHFISDLRSDQTILLFILYLFIYFYIHIPFNSVPFSFFPILL